MIANAITSAFRTQSERKWRWPPWEGITDGSFSVWRWKRDFLPSAIKEKSASSRQHFFSNPMFIWLHNPSKVQRFKTHKNIQTLQLHCGSLSRKFGLCWWHSKELHIFSPSPHERGPQNRNGDSNRKAVLSTSGPQQMQLSIESQRTPLEDRKTCVCLWRGEFCHSFAR